MAAVQRDRVRTGLALRDPLAWHDVVEVVETAEQTGYEALFLPEIRARETFSTLAGLAGVTSTLKLGTGVVTIVARKPAITAMAAATVHDLSGGRMILGLGSGPAEPGALDRLRTYLTTVSTILAGERVEGEQQFRLALAPGPTPVPIWIAALGPKAMRLAGEVADGVLLNWCPPERVVFARGRIREGAEAAGRDPADVTVAVYVRACIEHDEDVALPALAAAAAQYASYPAYRRQFEAVGLGAEAAAAARALAEGLPQTAPEALVRAVCLLGDADEAGRGLQAYRDAGADLPVVYPVPALEPTSSIMGTLFGLAPRPAVES